LACGRGGSLRGVVSGVGWSGSQYGGTQEAWNQNFLTVTSIYPSVHLRYRPKYLISMPAQPGNADSSAFLQSYVDDR
jgi:hypothetical protein